MNMTDELERLSTLHKGGALSDEEFAKAKRNLLEHRDSSPPPGTNDSLGTAANRYVTFQIVMAIIGVIVFLIVLFGVILPSVSPHSSPPITFPSHVPSR
jgi:hypothetical protein